MNSRDTDSKKELDNNGASRLRGHGLQQIEFATPTTLHSGLRRAIACAGYRINVNRCHKHDQHGQIRYNEFMRTVNISDLKAQLSAHIQRVKDGEEVLICDRNKPVARIIPAVQTTGPNKSSA